MYHHSGEALHEPELARTNRERQNLVQAMTTPALPSLGLTADRSRTEQRTDDNRTADIPDLIRRLLVKSAFNALSFGSLGTSKELFAQALFNAACELTNLRYAFLHFSTFSRWANHNWC